MAFRLDASHSIGIGHLVRCLRIATEMRKSGISVSFVLSHFSKDWSGRLYESGFPTYFLNHQNDQNCSCVDPENSRPELVWSAKSQELDAREFAALSRTLNISTVVIDHYGLDIVWEQAVSKILERLVVIDDLANREHDCDILVDYNFSSKANRYEALVPSRTKLMLGPKYAPLTEEHFRQDRPDVSHTGIRRVFISMGGGIGPGLLKKVVATAAVTFSADVEIRVMLPLRGDSSNKLGTLIPQQNVKFFSPLPTLVEEYRIADLAIGAAGVAAFERMVLGTPSVTLLTADNQVSSAEGMSLQTSETFLDARGQFSESDFRSALLEAVQEHALIRERADLNKYLVDRFGLARLVRAVLPTSSSEISIRQAVQEDCATYFHWANDSQVRQSSLTQEAVAIATHVSWFRQAISSPDTLLFVGESGSLPIGQVRFHKENFEWWLSYSIDKDFRGRGLGRTLIQLALMKFSAAHPNTAVYGVVKNGNNASIKLLEATGFVVSHSNDEHRDLKLFIWDNFQPGSLEKH